jgi:16S rRNA processing protein RimM
MTSSSRAEELIDLAAVARAHGLRGELLLKPFNPGSAIWPELKRVFLRAPDGTLREHVVERGHLHGMQVILGLREVRGREAAEALRGSVVCVPRSDLPELEEDEHYLVDLVGLEARDAQGQTVGKVVDVIEYPSACCLVVETAEGRIEVPDVDRYVTAIDMGAGFVSVENLEDLEVLREKGTR